MVFIIEIEYTVDLTQIDALMADHAAWLDVNYGDGTFIASGRKVPRTGGVILTASVERSVVEAAVRRDPFAIADVATHTILEFTPTRVADGVVLHSGATEG
jgi:uncharacterized protein YciI